MRYMHNISMGLSAFLISVTAEVVSIILQCKDACCKQKPKDINHLQLWQIVVLQEGQKMWPSAIARQLNQDTRTRINSKEVDW